MPYSFNPLTGGMDHTDEGILVETTAETTTNTNNITALQGRATTIESDLSTANTTLYNTIADLATTDANLATTGLKFNVANTILTPL